jgi:hypothetical protein
MDERTDLAVFCKGFIIGSLVGLVVAAYARAGSERSQAFGPDSNEPINERIPEPSHTFRQHSTELDMRREAPENAGDPTRLAPSVTAGHNGAEDQAVTIERSSGNPGPSSTAELLEVPGQPGRLLDHSDAAQSVGSALRTHKIAATRT